MSSCARCSGCVLPTNAECPDDKIGPEGILNLFSELGVDSVTVEALIFAWKLDAAVPFEFTRSEFTQGCVKLGCDSLDKLKREMRTFIAVT